jgi:hypothetical protein
MRRLLRLLKIVFSTVFVPKKLHYTGLVFAVVHLYLIGDTVAWIISGKEPAWPMMWLAFMGIDFPAFVIFIPITSLVGFTMHSLGLSWNNGGYLADPVNFWCPLIVFGIFGTLWWYKVGGFLEKTLLAIVNKNVTK